MTSLARRANPDDIPDLVEMMAEFYAESGLPLDREWASSAFDALLGNPALGAVWIALREGRPAAYAVLCIRFGMEFGGLEGFIDDLFVRTAFRRVGLGHALITAMFADCVERKILAVHVEVDKNNIAARTLYGHFGLGLRGDDREILSVCLDDAA